MRDLQTAVPPADVGQPEWRSALLAEAIRHTAHLAGPVNPNTLFRHLQAWLGLPEEACGEEIRTTLFLMVRSGLFTSDSHDRASGDLWLGTATRFTPSRTLTAYLHGEAVHLTDDEDDAD